MGRKAARFGKPQVRAVLEEVAPGGMYRSDVYEALGAELGRDRGNVSRSLDRLVQEGDAEESGEMFRIAQPEPDAAPSSPREPRATGAKGKDRAEVLRAAARLMDAVTRLLDSVA